MIFSTPTAYALRALVELAARAGNQSLMLEELAEGTDLPRQFVRKLFAKLVRTGVLISIKGRSGGFRLARPAHAISLMQIVSAIDGEDVATGCALKLGRCSDAEPCAQHDLYKPIRQRLVDYLQTTTLADLSASLKSKPAWRELCGKSASKEHA